MKKGFLIVALLVAVLGAGFAYAGRQRIAQVVADATRPAVPPAAGPEAFATSTVDAPRNAATSAPAAPAPAVQPATVKDVNLAVPFLLQAPYQNWVQPYEDACEEASAAMVHGYWTKKAYSTPERADAALTELFVWERETFGTDKDADAEQVARLLREHYGHAKVAVRYDFSAEDVRKELRAGRPVIIPAYGKALGNPNFRNGGPVYHMLVVKGYIGTDKFITNDPGTRKGADYVYAVKTIMAAAHDWNGGDVPNGRRAMIVVFAD